MGAGVPVEGAALAAPAAPAPAHDTRGRAPRATPTQKQGKSGGHTLQHGGGPRPGVLRLAPETKLHFRAGATKRGKCAGRLELNCGAGTVGEFFDRHPEPEPLARADLTNDLKMQLCKSDPLLRPCDFKRVELDHAGRARAVLAAAARGRAPDALAAAVGAVTAAGVEHVPSEAKLLGSFASFEAHEREPAQEWIAEALGSLGALVPDGAGGGFRGYEDVLMPADLCSAVELRRAAALDELRDQDGKPCAPRACTRTTSRSRR